ncbi:MAG: HDOD domain-containing protein [Syntrophobacteraceae bacterium]|nr:HDOD domain-containing protein [Syntrophobacteraceae bacterium]
MASKPQEFDILVAKLSGQDMPVFAATARQIAEMSSKEESSISDITLEVLKDPSLTSKVLAFANSSENGIASAKINTISRAVMQLGFNVIKDVTLSASLIETVLKGQKREKVLSEIARSLHAATQAKKLGAVLRDVATEEIFIASLLQRLGHIAFWSFGGEQADRLEKAIIEHPDIAEEVLERDVLGFSLNELTLKLASKWSLNYALCDSLNSGIDNKKVRCIRLGHAVAKEVAENGIEGEKFDLLTRAISKFLNTDQEKTRSLIIENVTEATEVARNFGIKDLSKYIPKGDKQSLDSEPTRKVNEPDDMLQVEVLAELMAMHRERRLNLNNFLTILVEGISRGLGMDRVILSIIDKERTSLTGRYGVGVSSVDTERFAFQLDPQIPTSLSEAVRNKGVDWAGYSGRYDKFFTDEVKWRVRAEEFFIGTIQVRGRVIAGIYCDRSISGRKLTEESFMDFKYFIKTANAILAANF